MASSEQEMFASMVRGKSDEELYGVAQIAGGPAPLLDQAFGAMANAVDPDRAPDTRVGFVVDDKGTKHGYTLVVKDKKGSVEKANPPEAPVTMETSFPDFVRLMARDLDWTEAFSTGRIQTQGDVTLLMQLQNIFRQPA